MLECTIYQEEEHIARITLNRPQVLNALNRQLWKEICQNLERAEENRDIRAIIITGAGRAFCSGDDIKEVGRLQTPREVRVFFETAVNTITKLVRLPKPVIAAVNGPAYGGGCEIAMLCDLVVASEEATFAVPEGLIGAIPPIASVIGSYIVGKMNASLMMLTGKSMAAHEAKQIGLVNEVVSATHLIRTAEDLARSTMATAPSSIRSMKKLARLRFREEELSQAVEELINIVQSDEGKEGHMAFAEKRRPSWVKT